MSDYLEMEETPQTALEQVMSQVDVYMALLDKIEETEKILTDLKKREQEMNRTTIPTLLQSHGLSDLGLQNGKRLVVSDELAVSVPKDETKRRVVLNWLAQNGGEELIKTEIAFQDPDEDVKLYLQDHGFTFTEDKTVNTNSLLAWFRAAVGLKKNTVARIDPKDVPPEANLFLYKKTKITEEK